MNPIKVLFCASHPSQPIGYSKIAQILVNALASYEDIKVHYFAFSYYSKTALEDRYVNPAIDVIDVLQEEGLVNGRENFGVNIIEYYLTTIKPDIVFIYNDIIVTCRLINALIEYKKKQYAHKFKTISYLDLVYKHERFTYLRHVNLHTDLVFVFTPSWRQHLIDKGFDEKKVRILPHGINKHALQPMLKEDAKKELHIDQESFVVLNTNRNCYRKMWDITIKAFLLFLKKHECDPKIKLLANCRLEDPAGFRIVDLIHLYCEELQIDPTVVMNTNIITLPTSGSLSDEIMNTIYHVGDVGINTCCGEGFGLCNVEHAYVGAPQIVSYVGGLKDIFSNQISRVITPATSIHCSSLLDDHNGELEICRAEDFAEALDFYYTNPEIRKVHGETAKKLVGEGFDWDKIIERFFQDLSPYMV